MRVSGKGQSADHGIGNKAVAMLRETGVDDATMKKIKGALAKAVTAIKGLSVDEQRVVGLALASDFTLDSLAVKSTMTRVLGPRLGARDVKRIAAIESEHGKDAAAQFEKMLLWSKEKTKGNGKA